VTNHFVSVLLLDLALILVVARLVGSASVRYGQPRVIGVAGVLIGPTNRGGSVAFVPPGRSRNGVPRPRVRRAAHMCADAFRR
jgi:hypothetical protein